MMKYRLLDDGEIIQEGDEFFSCKTLSWENVKADSQGETFFEDDDLPMRRPIECEPVPEQKTITVRIAVAVDPETEAWFAGGWSGHVGDPDDNEKRDFAIKGLPNVSVYWVEAVIPIFEPPVIVGTVTEGE